MAGVVIMLIIMFGSKEPKDPIDEFVSTHAVRKGFHMSCTTDINYFLVIIDDNGKVRDIGVSLHSTIGTPLRFLKVNPNGSVTAADLSYGYNTVFSVSTDEHGYSTFRTLVFDDKGNSKVMLLTLDDNCELKLAEPISKESKLKQQKWLARCIGDVWKDEDGHLISASFIIQNAEWTERKLIVNGYGESGWTLTCLLYTSPSPRDATLSRMPSSA